MYLKVKIAKMMNENTHCGANIYIPLCNGNRRAAPKIHHTYALILKMIFFFDSHCLFLCLLYFFETNQKWFPDKINV